MPDVFRYAHYQADDPDLERDGRMKSSLHRPTGLLVDLCALMSMGIKNNSDF